jgi:predicted DNA-binding transcriptional regulator AlpA
MSAVIPSSILYPKNSQGFPELPRSRICSKISLGYFPNPISLGQRATVSLVPNIEQWIKSRLGVRGAGRSSPPLSITKRSTIEVIK